MKILIADDHRLIVEAVAGKLAELGPEVVVLSAFSVPEMAALLHDGVGLALIDLGMPGARGIDHVLQVRRDWPALKIIVLSGVEDQAVVRAAMDAGASGFIPKACSPDALLAAVREVLAGGIYLPPTIGLGWAFDGGTGSDATTAPALDPYAVALIPPTAELRGKLTDRQLDVLSCLSAGLPNKEIARKLGISEGTVKIHLTAIFRTLHARNRTEAVIAARALVDTDEFKENQALA